MPIVDCFVISFLAMTGVAFKPSIISYYSNAMPIVDCFVTSLLAMTSVALLAMTIFPVIPGLSRNPHQSQ
jgi:hypothetical protein